MQNVHKHLLTYPPILEMFVVVDAWRHNKHKNENDRYGAGKWSTPLILSIRRRNVIFISNV